MLILPVWMSAWEIGCCGDEHEARLGYLWEGMLLVEQIEAWRQSSSRELGWRRVGDGWIDFVARTLDSPRYGPASPVLDLGSCRVGAPRLTASGFIGGRGRVVANWHEGFDPERDSEILVDGYVRRVSLRRRIVERRSERSWRVVGHEAPVDVASSLEAGRKLESDVLVELMIGTFRGSASG